MRIADVMTRDLPTVEPGSSVRDAAREMRARGVRALPVCEGTRLVGIVTDWDLAAALADEDDPSEPAARRFHEHRPRRRRRRMRPSPRPPS